MLIVVAEVVGPIVLAIELHRTANPAVSKVACDVLPVAVSLGAAPGRGEAPIVGAGLVDLSMEDEGELTGGGAGWCRSGGASRTAGVTVSPGSSHVVTVAVNGGGAPGFLEAPVHGAGVVDLAHELEWEDTGGPDHGSAYGLAVGGGGGSGGCSGGGGGANVDDY